MHRPCTLLVVKFISKYFIFVVAVANGAPLSLYLMIIVCKRVVYFCCLYILLSYRYVILFVFIIVGIKSLFPIIAAFWGLLILCIYHFPEPVAIIAIIFWIVVMTTIEIAARTGCFDESEGENKKNSDKNGHS